MANHRVRYLLHQAQFAALLAALYGLLTNDTTEEQIERFYLLDPTPPELDRAEPRQ